MATRLCLDSGVSAPLRAFAVYQQKLEKQCQCQERNHEMLAESRKQKRTHTYKATERL